MARQKSPRQEAAAEDLPLDASVVTSMPEPGMRYALKRSERTGRYSLLNDKQAALPTRTEAGLRLLGALLVLVQTHSSQSSFLIQQLETAAETNNVGWDAINSAIDEESGRRTKTISEFNAAIDGVSRSDYEGMSPGEMRYIIAEASLILHNNYAKFDDQIQGFIDKDLHPADSESDEDRIRQIYRYAQTHSEDQTVIYARGLKPEIEGAAHSQTVASRNVTEASAESKAQGAPKNAVLWRDRDPADTPVSFVMKHYGVWREGLWDPAGLTKPDLRHDEQLYNALATYERRHPESRLNLPTKRQANDAWVQRILDGGEAPTSQLEKERLAVAARRRGVETTERVPWSSREADDTPITFIRKHFGVWKDGVWDRDGLTKPDLRKTDLQLYNALSTWEKRHPQDRLGLPNQKDEVARWIDQMTNGDATPTSAAERERLRSAQRRRTAGVREP
jgi:hypothetical protein